MSRKAPFAARSVSAKATILPFSHEAGSIGVTTRYAKHRPEYAAHAAREKLDRSRDTVAEETGEYAA